MKSLLSSVDLKDWLKKKNSPSWLADHDILVGSAMAVLANFGRPRLFAALIKRFERISHAS
jgi:hypothetical protein